MKFFTLIACLCLADVRNALPPDPEEAPPPKAAAPKARKGDVKEGIYRALGDTNDGGTSRGAVTIQRVGEGFLVQYATSEPRRGLGLQTGDVMSVFWSGPSGSGVTQYRVEGNRLVGRWVGSPFDGYVRDEVLVFVSGFGDT